MEENKEFNGTGTPGTGTPGTGTPGTLTPGTGTVATNLQDVSVQNSSRLCFSINLSLGHSKIGIDQKQEV